MAKMKVFEAKMVPLYGDATRLRFVADNKELALDHAETVYFNLHGEPAMSNTVKFIGWTDESDPDCYGELGVLF